jgi:hypothetical protein
MKFTQRLGMRLAWDRPSPVELVPWLDMGIGEPEP